MSVKSCVLTHETALVQGAQTGKTQSILVSILASQGHETLKCMSKSQYHKQDELGAKACSESQSKRNKIGSPQ